MNTAIVTDNPIAPVAPPQMMRVIQARIVAERLLQVRTGRADASLSALGPASRQLYEDAAAVALALLEDDADVPALYAAANHEIDLEAQTPAQRRELVAMTRRIVDRFHEVLAGHHVLVVERLQPLIDRDRRAADDELDMPAGGI